METGRRIHSSPRAGDIVLTIPKWVGALFKRKQPSVRLICMRVDDMVKAHPKQLTDQCSECGHVIGIPPSGMRVIAADKYSGHVKIICQICNTAEFGMLASGVEQEEFSLYRRTHQNNGC